MLNSLEMDLYDLEAEVGDLAGFGVGARFDDTAWTTDQQRRITKCVHAGCRSVYFTQSLLNPNGQPIDGIPAGYNWSFLKPRSTIELLDGGTEILLPADCNGLLGDLVPVSTDGVAQFTIKVVPFETIYAARAVSSTTTGRPAMCCEQVVKGTTKDRGSRYKLQVYPIADQDYTLQVWYEVNPAPLSAEYPHPYGGAPLAECFKAAVRAAYEQDFDGLRGPETERFVERLRAAIAADRKHHPLYLGVNSDHSDDVYLGRRLHGEWDVPFLVNGTAYTEAR